MDNNIEMVKMFTTTASRFNVLNEAILSAMDHLKQHKDASIAEALCVGLMDWDVDYQIEKLEKEVWDKLDSMGI